MLQQENYSKLNKKQYIDLNTRIQKSLILDFDFESAKQSAFEDWKIDREREKIEKGDKEEDTEQKIIEDENESQDDN